MKTISTLLFFLILSLALSAQPTPSEVIINKDYSRASKIREKLDLLISKGVPGCTMAVYSGEGWWTTSAGLADIGAQSPMTSAHLQYLQSVAKTYMAVGILKLYEDGKIKLDAPITAYLPEKYTRQISDAGKITVRMLLNHTSGVPEYNMQPAYVSYLLQHPDYVFDPAEYLGFIREKPLDFEPGSRYSYRNTNYLLLAFVADEITGNHAQYLDDTIFKPLGLPHTFYRNAPGYLHYNDLVHAYWDRNSNYLLEDVTELQRTNVMSLVGDDGIVTTPVEAVRFLRGLLEGELLADSTLTEMMTWVKDASGHDQYGLGLDYAEMDGHVAYGHSGGGIGAGCQLYYFPKENTYMFVAINLGTVTDSPIHKDIGPVLDEIYSALLD